MRAFSRALLVAESRRGGEDEVSLFIAGGLSNV
jgi:hypothetical protein